ncbi:MAG: diacylglycerol kinase family protein, partial [Candidatus Omnitrophica bacterium]|nr:diacylglycerol kinase family protein [Candidatus Omnitrophota bacterium]
MPHRTFFQSLNDAVEGFFYVVKNERNMRIHFFLAFFIVLSGALLGVRGLEWVVLCTALTFLLVTEMINTVVEEITDFVESSTHPTVRIIKDMSAGAVLLSAVNALVVVFFIFSKHVTWPLQFTALQVRHAPWHVSFIALLMIVFLVVTVKTVFHRG